MAVASSSAAAPCPLRGWWEWGHLGAPAGLIVAALLFYALDLLFLRRRLDR